MKNSKKTVTSLELCRLSVTASAVMLLLASQASWAQDDKSDKDTANAVFQTVQINSKRVKSTTALSAQDIQAPLSGSNPLKSLEYLPGVSYQTADPWGNNEQNASLFVHGFSAQQLGYTLDGVPLGDQQYGNWNGLSPQRAIISENVSRVVLSTGAGDLGTASASNLGGTIEMFSSNPKAKRGASFEQTLGSFETSRTMARYDTGINDDSSAYFSVLNQRARAWDFPGYQGGTQFNAKFVKSLGADRLTAFFDYNQKVEPNEDSITRKLGEAYLPYTRPFIYPNLAAYQSYLNPSTGATPAAQADNYSNYYSAAQRRDYLTYIKYDSKLAENTTLSNMFYLHKDNGAGLVAGPIGVAGLPGLFGVYYPGQNLNQVFGGSNIALRTTEYQINRPGFTSKIETEIGDHKIQAGLWWEQNQSTQARNWYPFTAANPGTPYQIPSGNPNFTQYSFYGKTIETQLHLQDSWSVSSDLTLQAGFKSTIQNATGQFPVQQKLASISGTSTGLPVGSINTTKPFLPQLGAVWSLSPQDEIFANVQQNIRQFINYGAGGLSPWSLSSQAAFDLFKNTVQPETSTTYELGYRGSRKFNGDVLTAIDGQVNMYHVDFRNRLLAITSTPTVNTINPGNPILANVGGVTTNGIDLGGTLHFGNRFSFYNALSYNHTTYNNNYATGATGGVINTSGMQVPGSPQWLEKFVLTAQIGDVEAQLLGDYVGKRYATYTNDVYVNPYLLMSMNVTRKMPELNGALLKDSKLRLTVTNLANTTGDMNVIASAPSNTTGGYATYPIPPRMFFVTFSGSF